MKKRTYRKKIRGGVKKKKILSDWDYDFQGNDQKGKIKAMLS